MDRRLYEDDFYLWSQDQAAALRAAAVRAPAGANAVDWELVAEEVEDLGGSQLRECLSRTATIIEHLYKLAETQFEAPKAGWRHTILVQRRDLLFAVTPSIRRLLEARLDELHQKALAIAQSAFAHEEPGVAIDAARRWPLPAILGEKDDPLA